MCVTDTFLFRKIVIAAILGTDMAVHFELVSKLSTHLTTKGPQTSEPDDRLLLMTYILHAADISNVCKPLEISKRWSNFVFEEFLNQVRETYMQTNKHIRTHAHTRACTHMEKPTNIFLSLHSLRVIWNVRRASTYRLTWIALTQIK